MEDRPTLTAPGNLIISTRTVSPIGVVGTPDDVLAGLEPAYLPYYTTLSGTSMAAPHVAGVVALMLDANPALTPLQLKSMLQSTATPMPRTRRGRRAPGTWTRTRPSSARSARGLSVGGAAPRGPSRSLSSGSA